MMLRLDPPSQPSSQISLLKHKSTNTLSILFTDEGRRVAINRKSNKKKAGGEFVLQ